MSTRRQPSYSVANEHISGLAAPDAEVPHLMTAGFVALGACTVTFAAELDDRLGGAEGAGLGPLLMGAGGLTMIAAGLFRRDRLSNYPMPGEPDERQSWRNDAHDLAAVGAGAAGVLSLLALAMRFSRDPAWRDLALPAASAALAGGGLSAWFASDVTRPGNGLVQRATVSIPLGFMARVALRLLRRPA